MPIRPPLLALLLFAAAWALPAEPAGVVYQLPAGWDDRAEGPGRRLTAPVSAPGDVLTVVLSAGPRAEGDPEALLAAWTEADLPASADLSRTPVVRRKDGDRTVLTLTRKVRHPALGDHERLYQLVADGSGTALALVTARGAATLKAQADHLLALLASVRPPAPAVPVSPPAPIPAAPVPVPRLEVPYGETPDRLPGDPAFRPSGRGRPLPAPGLTDDGPAGLWWTPAGRGQVSTLLFFADGTLARHFRPGGPLLADTAGMKAGPGAEDLGTWALTQGTLSLKFAFQSGSGAFVPYRDVSGDFFRMGSQVYRPARPLETAQVKGRWRGPGGSVVFGPDGALNAGAGTLGAQALQGRWWAEGTLLIVETSTGSMVLPGFVPLAGQLVLGTTLYTRE